MKHSGYLFTLGFTLFLYHLALRILTRTRISKIRALAQLALYATQAVFKLINLNVESAYGVRLRKEQLPPAVESAAPPLAQARERRAHDELYHQKEVQAAQEQADKFSC